MNKRPALLLIGCHALCFRIDWLRQDRGGAKVCQQVSHFPFVWGGVTRIQSLGRDSCGQYWCRGGMTRLGQLAVLLCFDNAWPRACL